MHTRISAIETLESRRLLSIAPMAMGTTAAPPVAGSIISPGVMPVGVTIHAEATDRFSGTVGILRSFTPPPIVGPAAVGLQESINWGDGTASSDGNLVGGSRRDEFLVKGSHTYAKPGTFKITVTVIWGPLPGSGLMIPSFIIATINSTGIVGKDVDGGVKLNEVAGRRFEATVGSFDFRSIDLLLSATIDWGDGTHAAGKIVGDFATGEWHVVGAHTYAKAGKYAVQVKVLSRIAGAPATFPGGTVARWSSTINVRSSV